MTQHNDFLSAYLSYAATDSEVPVVLHRWAAISSIGALLGRNFYFTHGHFNINPNLYTMLIGVPATRKSTAIKLAKKLITMAGYDTIAADKSSKEKFLMDMAGIDDTEGKKSAESFLDDNLWGDDTSTAPPAECFIMADELNDFIGNGNIEFISLLGSLWDYNGVYSSRIKSGKSVSINNPTVSILSGNTPTGFALAFPTEIIGQGFFSRILLIYAEPTGKRITFPKQPSDEDTATIVKYLQAIRSNVRGAATLDNAAFKLLDKIYQTYEGIDDARFISYTSRRFNQLIKLTLIITAARLSTHITEHDVIYANTILSASELNMPKALGEFGKSKFSDVTHKIVTVLENSNSVMSFKEIWKHVSSDLEKMTSLAEMLQGLVTADKIQAVPGGSGFVAKRRKQVILENGTVDYSLLHIEERP